MQNSSERQDSVSTSAGGILTVTAAQVDHRNLGAVVNFQTMAGDRVIGFLECITIKAAGGLTFTVAGADYKVEAEQEVEVSLPRQVISLMNISRYVNDLKDAGRHNW
ncbi:hypothetical protein [Micrococcoides hystricis]|uniref:Uncharacterized protein n=1 Tax=Micrococcoides hystricis TaxID=1572761 RepID=A0ABV6PAQ0_9MICC